MFAHSTLDKFKSKKTKRERGSIFAEFLNMFFGQSSEGKVKNKKEDSKKIQSKGENVETEIGISISEAFYGAEKKISLRMQSGNMKTFSIKIPAGIRNHEKIRLIGQGKKGNNGGKAGDLLIKINIENDKEYKLVGVDLYTKLLLTPWEAALGTKATIETIDDEISLHVPQGTQSGELIKIAQKGYKDGKGGRGNLFAEVNIMIPKNMTSEEKELFGKLAETSKYNPRKIK